MSVIFFLIGCSIVLALAFLIAFFWAVKNGQIEDLYTPSVRILFDDGVIEQQEEDQSEPNTIENENKEKPITNQK